MQIHDPKNVRIRSWCYYIRTLKLSIVIMIIVPKSNRRILVVRFYAIRKTNVSHHKRSEACVEFTMMFCFVFPGNTFSGRRIAPTFFRNIRLNLSKG